MNLGLVYDGMVEVKPDNLNIISELAAVGDITLQVALMVRCTEAEGPGRPERMGFPHSDWFGIHDSKSHGDGSFLRWVAARKSERRATCPHLLSKGYAKPGEGSYLLLFQWFRLYLGAA